MRQFGVLIDFVLGPQPLGTLPQAAEMSLLRDRQSSELLVCAVQFSAIAFFGVFYTLTPKAFPDSVPFEPVPLALVLYTIFTLIRLTLAILNRLSGWFIGLSVVVDIAVLMITIWSFHLQYREPPTMYLKAPTLLYAFILIALRVLRFEPVWIILAGVSAIAGWVILVAFALIMTPDTQITKSFAVYASSSSMLIGAEVDKLLSLAAVTAVLAIAAVRARRLLVRAAAEAHASAQLSRFFAPEVASDIRRTFEKLKPGDAMLRDAAVMMIDLRGFTKLASRLSPEQTLAFIAEYHRRVVPAIGYHHGSIDKYLGDGIMATFGAAKPSSSFAADALRAQSSILEAIRSWSAERSESGEDPVDIGCAVATGPMLCGVIGVSDRLEWTVIGDAANMAAKLEKHCKVAKVTALATSETLALAHRQGLTNYEWTSLPAQRVFGIEYDIDLFTPKLAAVSMPQP